MRTVMGLYWQDRSKKVPGMHAMLTDTNAEAVALEEEPEILSFLPRWKGKRVLELAGGTGRFTGQLAEQASHVTTVDFTEAYMNENRARNKSHTNINFVSSDVLDLSFEAESFDLIFTNWLLIYLTDKEINDLLHRASTWLTDEGHMFFRESCYRPSGNIEIPNNPSMYRTLTEFNHFFRYFKPNGPREKNLKVVFARPLLSYIRLKENRNQVCWLVENQKNVSDESVATFEESTEEIGRHIGHQTEKSSLQTEGDLIKNLNLANNDRVLDVGCGNGDRGFHIAEVYGADVLGIDTSWDCIEAAWNKKSDYFRYAKICFEFGDITRREYPAEYFDAIILNMVQVNTDMWSSMYENYMMWLKPVGNLLILGSDDSKLASPDGGSLTSTDHAKIRNSLEASSNGTKVNYTECNNGRYWLLIRKSI